MTSLCVLVCTFNIQKMMNLNMPLVDGKVTFNATLFALVRTALKVQCQGTYSSSSRKVQTLYTIITTTFMHYCIGCPECSTKCNVDLKKKLLILFPTMAEKQINGVLAKDDGRSKFAYGDQRLIITYHTDETIGKKYAALLIQHIWRSRAARTRKVMEMFQGSQGTIRLRVSEDYHEHVQCVMLSMCIYPLRLVHGQYQTQALT